MVIDAKAGQSALLPCQQCSCEKRAPVLLFWVLCFQHVVLCVVLPGPCNWLDQFKG